MKNYEWLRDRIANEEGRQRIEKVKQLVPLAGELGCSMSQLAIAWCIKNPHVSTVITGASKAWQVVENMKSLDVLERMDDSVMERIEQILENKPNMPYDCRLMN